MVIGAARGVGDAVSNCFSDEGASVFLCDSNGVTDTPVYSLTTGLVTALCRCMTIELPVHNIWFKTIAPVPTRTPRDLDILEGKPIEATTWQIPFGRPMQSEDVVRVATFLLSEDAAFVSGSAAPVDGAYLVVGS